MTTNRASFWRAVPFVPQMEIVECGAACLAMVLGFFGKQVPLADLRRACGVSRDGVTALSIYRAAQAYDLEVQALKASLEDLARLPLPAIVHWEFNHFVVLEKCSRAGAVIVDPAVGRRFVPRQELDELYTGVALTFGPGARFQRSARQRCDLLRYLSVLRLCPAAVTMVLLATLAAEILGVVFPAFNQLLIDHVLKPARYGWLWPLVAMLGVALLARLLLLLIRDRLLAVLQFTVDATVTTHFVRHLSQLPAEFFQHRSPGDLLQRVAANQTLRELSSRFLAAMLDGVLLMSDAALLVAYDMTLGALTIVLSVFRMGLLGLLRRQMQQATATELVLRGKELGASVESLGFPETVRAFGIEAALMERYTNRLNLRLNASVALKTTAAINQRLAQLFDGVSMALILWMGGQAVITDQMTLGVFAGFITLQGLLRAPLASLMDAYTQWVYARGILARLDDVVQTAVEASGCQTIETMTGAVSFTDVSFRHGPEAPWVVQNVTLHIAPGELVALVGPSGAGKSTLLRLLLGFLEPTQGVIGIDGIALSDLDRPAWRRQVGSLLPEPCFFNDTVRANLSLYNDSLPMHVLEEAARQACIHETLQGLPEGYHTRLGERGARLSGGQRQRLALARAFIGQPYLLILDEPTAALDPDTEMQIMHSLLQMDCTRIFITHRLDTTRLADRIVVFDQGQVVQEGHFDDLSQRPGLFQDMLGTLCHDYSDIS